MPKNSIEKSAFSEAYRRWFSAYEQERKRRKVRRGASLPGFPPAPTAPEAVQAAVDRVGRARVLELFGIHRHTLARWLSGETLIPRPAWLLLVAVADGRLPGMSADWSEFRFVEDRICLVGTRYSWTARELAGFPYQAQHARALSARIMDMEKQMARLLQLGHFESANDPVIRSA